MDECHAGAAPDSGRDFGTAAVCFVKHQRPFQEGSFQLEHVRAKQGELRGDLFEHAFIEDSRMFGLEVRTMRRAKTGKVGVLKNAQTRIGRLPPLAQMLLLKPGDMLVLRCQSMLGRLARRRKTGELIALAQIGVSLPQVLDHAKPGEPIWFDDGNLPETRIDIPALTSDDLEALKFIVQNADLVGYSFVRTESDVRELLDRLEELDGQHLGLILKIETRKSFDNLPKLILAAMRTRSFGIM